METDTRRFDRMSAGGRQDVDLDSLKKLPNFASLMTKIRTNPEIADAILYVISTTNPELHEVITLNLGRLLSQPQLPYDCLERVYSFAGLRPLTLQAITRAMGYDAGDQEQLIRTRCNPLPLLATLVANPEELLWAMQDCEALLSGSRAAGYFWPACSTEESDWDFYTHPDRHHWLRFALYLASIGVIWDIPERTIMDDGEEGFKFPFEYPGNNPVLNGTIKTRGHKQRVQLITHDILENSSIVPILYYHSSIVQCFISGSAAFSMYSHLTTSGRSRTWEPRNCERELQSNHDGAQHAIRKYISRGVKYIGVSSDPEKVPHARWRSLDDAETLCIPFEKYLSDDARKQRARFDLTRMKAIRWIQHMSYLKDQGGLNRMDVDETAAEQSADMTSPVAVPLFEELEDAFACQRCDTDRGRFCAAHTQPSDQLELVQALLFRIYQWGGYHETYDPWEADGYLVI